MATKVKIKIRDNPELRKEIDRLYETLDQISLAKWSLSLAKHILEIAEIDFETIEEIVEGFRINELWQKQQANVHSLREVGFKIHKIARESNSEIRKTALRVVGQAVSSGHMKEHAMVASDYAIKTIGLIYANNMEKITLERKWQLNEIMKYL